MTIDEKEKRISASGKAIGRPEKPEAERLSVRIVVKVTPEMAAAAERRAEMLSTPAATASPASYVRMLMEADLRAHGLFGATSPACAAELPQELAAPPPPPTAPAPAPIEPTAAAAPPVQTPAAAPPAKPKPARDPDTDPDAVRELVKECFEAGMSMDELAKRVGFGDRAKFTHFKNANPERGKLSSEKLRTVAAACRRWQAEPGKVAR